MLIAPSGCIYFRDVYDHLIRMTDELDSYRELVSTTLDTYLSTINNNLSEDHEAADRRDRRSWPASARSAGIFGMSEAGAAIADTELTGFWLITAAIVVAALAAAWVLHRIGWI